MNDDVRGTCNTNSQIKFKTTMLKSSFYSDVYILAKRTNTGAGADAAAIKAEGRNKQVKFKNCKPFTDCISKTNNKQVVYAKDLDVVMRLVMQKH